MRKIYPPQVVLVSALPPSHRLNQRHCPPIAKLPARRQVQRRQSGSPQVLAGKFWSTRGTSWTRAPDIQCINQLRCNIVPREILLVNLQVSLVQFLPAIPSRERSRKRIPESY